MQAVPCLVRRVAQDHDQTLRVATTMILGSAGEIADERQLKKLVHAAALKSGRLDGVLIIRDSDGRCPKELGPQILEWASSVAGGRPVEVVIAKNEYENWFLAGAPSLAGFKGLPAKLQAPRSPEDVPDAKEWLAHRMPQKDPYSPARHQLAFTERVDLSMARARSASLDKCIEKILRLLSSLSTSRQAAAPARQRGGRN